MSSDYMGRVERCTEQAYNVVSGRLQRDVVGRESIDIYKDLGTMCHGDLLQHCLYRKNLKLPKGIFSFFFFNIIMYIYYFISGGKNVPF